MSDSIWNKYDIKNIPDENKLVVLIDKDDGFYNACFVDKIDWVNDWYDYVEKWCYLDELLAQVDKVERLQAKVDELEHIKNGWARFAEQKDEQIQRLQKAVCFIRNIRGAGMSYQDMFLDAHEVAKTALDPEHKPVLCGRYDEEILDEIKQL